MGVYQKHDVFARLNDFLCDVEPGGRVTTRALVIEGGEGVGKSYALQEVSKVAGQHGFGVIGPVDGIDLVGCPFCCSSNSRSAEPFGAQDPAGNNTVQTDAARPLLVAIDDGHLANPDRLRLEMRRRRTNHRSSIIWVVTTPALSRLPTMPVDEIAVTSITDLTEPAATAFAAEQLGGTPAPDLARLVAQAGGNPRLTKELVCGLREEARLQHVGGTVTVADAKLPQRVVRLVRQRLDTVSARCRWTLQVGAMSGTQFCPSAIAEAMSGSVADLIPRLEEATEAGLVSYAGREVGFRNILIWRVVRASVPFFLREAMLREATAGGQGRLWSNLSKRERTIARFAGEGLTNQQIAHRVFISPHTVNYHLRRIFQKLDVRSRIELTKLMADAGVFTNDEAEKAPECERGRAEAL